MSKLSFDGSSRQNKLDRSIKTPLHSQLAAFLRTKIRDRQLTPGSVLPTEADLQAQFDVSRSVVRQALAALAAEGLIERGKGRATTVAPPREYHRLVQSPVGLASQVALTGASTTTTVLNRVEEAGVSASAILGTTSTLRLERLRAVGGTPVGYIRTWLPLPACATLTSDELTNASLHDVMLQKLGLRVTGGGRQIRAVAADVELANLLCVQIGEPLLLLEGSSNDQHGRAIEVFATWHRADLVAFDIDVIEPNSVAGQSMTTTSEHNEPLRAAADQARRLAQQLDALATHSTD